VQSPARACVYHTRARQRDHARAARRQVRRESDRRCRSRSHRESGRAMPIAAVETASKPSVFDARRMAAGDFLRTRT